MQVVRSTFIPGHRNNISYLVSYPAVLNIAATAIIITQMQFYIAQKPGSGGTLSSVAPLPIYMVQKL